MSRPSLPELTDADVRRMAREAEVENLLLPNGTRERRGYHFRRAAIRLGVMPLCDITEEELAWWLGVVQANAGEYPLGKEDPNPTAA